MTADLGSRTPAPSDQASGDGQSAAADVGVDILLTSQAFPTATLLPPVVRRRREIRTAKRRLRIALALLLLIVGVWYGIARLAQANARLELANAQAELRAAQQAQEAYRDVPMVFAAVDAARGELALAMGSEVQLARLVSDLSAFTPTGVSLLQVSMVTSVEQDESAATVDAIEPVNSGTVEFAGRADTFDGVSAWIDALRANPDYNDVVLTEVSRDSTSGLYSFSNSAGLTEQALSGRFVEEQR